jgi:hypothetical protein
MLPVRMRDQGFHGRTVVAMAAARSLSRFGDGVEEVRHVVDNSLLANAAKISKRFHCKAYVQTGARMNKEEGGEDGGRVIAIQTLSNAELIKLLQFEVGDDGLMEMVEAELERRKTGGTKQ